MSLVFNHHNSEDSKMEFIEILGYNLRYLQFSGIRSTKTIVLLHGLGASAERWSELWPLMKKYNVIIPDLIGFGYSEKPLVEYTVDFFIKSLEQFFEKLNIRNPIIVGSSFGGQLVIEYSLKHKDFFDRIILVSPAGTLERPTFVLSQYIFSGLYPTVENVESAFKRMANNENYKVDPYTVKDFINRMKLPNAKYALISTLLAMRRDQSLQKRLVEISIPALVIWGSDDTTIPVENIEYFKQIPMVETLVMEGCGHTPYVEKPKEFFRIIEKFIDSE
ncbi:MAG: alpha/beta fold hydrolase [Candidatus Nitrosocosmicus sp.]|jgi:pimeloyl-ACP methyl ester carboxylesterase|uniref:alpha/beta fold hydrolase n=1 Tax=Candidatus Nitrosocosmicus agrestis TaxID=2563600 RepID=UPI00122E8D7D|nr:alpha/beta hydrolase [Candidatus Nitrosocosmicus sp. SS]KAA2279825.1 alpha/beta hydrolase [Candidatus Nitrosocosmicus sp. SS]KAF0870353.1 alpha/beta hydrolase [Candidatus Nitrosocosmicus sp. SS]